MEMFAKILLQLLILKFVKMIDILITLNILKPLMMQQISY